MQMLNRLIICSFILVVASISHSYGYNGYLKLAPDTCVPLEEDVIISKLPAYWHKYSSFIKICKLKQRAATTAPVSIISIWVLEYYDTRFPPPATHISESFPLPIVVNDKLRPIGQLPQQYPDDPPRELDIYYRETLVGIPSDVLIDVYNPAVNGDYYYAPLKWNPKSERYEMKDMETKYGKRRK